MPEGPGRFRRLAMGAALALLALAVSASVLGGLWMLHELRQAQQSVSHTREVIAEASGLLTTLVDAETAQRGFLLTGDERYLAPYHTALQRLRPDFERLENLVAAKPAQVARLRDMRAEAGAKFAELAETIARRRDGDEGGSLAVVRTEEGKRLMDGLRASMDAFTADERRLLDERMARASRDAAVSTGLMGLAGGLGVVLAVLAAVPVLRTQRAARMRAEEALSAEEAHARAILDLSPQVLWTARADGGFEDFTGRWLEWTGLSREETRGEGLMRACHPEDLPRVAAAWAQAVRTGRPFDIEHRLSFADGSPRWMRSRAVARRDPATGAVLRWYGATEDVHDRREAEAALRESEARFRAVVAQAPFPIMLHAEDGEVLQVSQSWQEISGWRWPEDIPTVAAWVRHAYGERQDSVRAAIDRLYALDRRVNEGDYRIRTASGAERVWSFASSPVGRDGRGRRLVVSMAADLTGLREAEAALRDLAATLEQRVEERTQALSDTVAELEAFAHSVSHDLRAPLRAMEGFAQALIEDHAEDLGPRGRRYAERIAGAAARMDQLIEDLLKYSRLGRAELELRPVSLDAAMEAGLADVAQGLARSGGTVEVERPLPMVIGSAAVLRQITGNLIGNAVKFVPPDEAPAVRVFAEPRPPSAPGAPPRVRLVVEDSGIGVAPEHRDRIFRVFERLHADSEYPGTGIGLAIVRRGAERLGATAGTEPRPDGARGSRFWVEFVAADAAAGQEGRTT